jgi:hypothetical protein
MTKKLADANTSGELYHAMAALKELLKELAAETQKIQALTEMVEQNQIGITNVYKELSAKIEGIKK